MELHPEQRDTERETPVCPLQDDSPQQGEWLTREVELTFAHHKSLFAQYRPGDGGATQLHLYYGEQEISFDEPELFAFGETLAKHPRFPAGAAVGWGAGYDWPRIRELLAQLVEEGVLLRAADVDDDNLPSRDLSRPSLLPPAPCATPRTWLQADEIVSEMFGRHFDVGYLELMMPVYRIVHMAMDGDGRQVGEANVWPKAMRVEVPTEWRLCPHAGSRHHNERPMNVSALKAMRAHWRPMMFVLAQVREAYVRRFPKARHGMTVGDVYCLSVLVLAIPAWLMMRTNQRVANGDLDPVLSSMFRVTDGVRLVMHLMMFTDDIEPALSLDMPMTGAEVYAYAERNGVFIAQHGVCAGPQALVEEFLRVLIEGAEVEDAGPVALSAQMQTALDEFDDVFDYGLLSLKAWAVTHAQAPMMTRTYERLAPLVEQWPTSLAESLQGFRRRFDASLTFLRESSRENTEERREKHDRVYAGIHARASLALGSCAPDSLDASLAHLLTARAMDNDAQADATLRCALSRLLATGADADNAGQLAHVLMDYLRRDQAIVRAAADIQRDINLLLGRSPPAQSLTGADIAVNYLLRSTVWSPEALADLGGRLPYLPDLLTEELGWRLVIRGETLEIAAPAA